MIQQFARTIRRRANLLGNRHTCYVCGKKFRRFQPYHGGSRNVPEFRKRLEMVGSDVDNFRCMYCGCTDRERHLIMYLDASGLWQHIRYKRVLHFAPEPWVSWRIEAQTPAQYIKADLNPTADDVQRIDATDIPYPDGSFDVVIANHVLEHIVSYPLALREFYRVMMPGGMAILQTPYSCRLWANFEDDGIDTPELRRCFYGEEDHVRLFGEFGLFYYVEDAGFTLDFRQHADYFGGGIAHRYGVNEQESLILAWKGE